MPGKNLQKMRTRDLKVGMFVHDVGRRWLKHPWPQKSKLLTSTRDIEQLLDYDIQEVIVDLNRGLPTPKKAERTDKAEQQLSEPPKTEDETDKQGQEAPQPVSFEEELPRARRIYISALEATREFLADTRAGRKINVVKVRDNVETMIDSTFRNRDATLALLKIKNYDEYTLTHSLNVAVLAISMGCHLDYSREAIRQLGMGAILHDLGKTKMPQEIINKKARLTEEEFKTIKFHPVIGAQMLEKTKGISDHSISITRYHHERIDGTGYPDGLTREQLNSFIIISSMSDVYDALSSDRVYHKAILPHEALRTLFSMRDLQFDRIWLERFIQCLGIYPAGTLVRLNTGEIALVLSVNRSRLLKPRIKLLYNSKNRPVSGEKILDLSDYKNRDREIIDVVDPKAVGLNLSILL